MTWKSPRPTSCTGYMSGPPPGSGSPLSGQSSSKTKTVTVAVGSGLGSTFTVTEAGRVHATAVPEPEEVHSGTTGAPPMVCPQLEGMDCPVAVVAATQLPAAAGSRALAVLNEFAASPGRIEM